MEGTELFLLVGSVILIFSVLAGKAGFRFGLPSLLLFLGVGMLFGSDGLGIQFNSPQIAQFIGTLALSIILFSGGMDTKIAEIKPIASQGVVLATFGVLATTFVTGGLLNLPFIQSLLFFELPGIPVVGCGHVINRLSFRLFDITKQECLLEGEPAPDVGVGEW